MVKLKLGWSLASDGVALRLGGKTRKQNGLIMAADKVQEYRYYNKQAGMLMSGVNLKLGKHQAIVVDFTQCGLR